MPVIRINYHEKNRTDLITGPVRDAHDALRARHPQSAVLLRSGWFRGPHLDLTVLGEGTDDACTQQAARIQEWLNAHPSAKPVDPAEYLLLSKKLGALEGVSGPFEPISPDNTVELVEYRPPRLVDGHEALEDAYIDFFSRATPLVFALTELKGRDPSAASMVLMGMMARVVDQSKSEGISSGYLSLRAHADFFFANFDRPGRVREQLDRMEAASRSAIDSAVFGDETLGVPESVRGAARAILRDWDELIRLERENVQAIARRDKSWFAYNPSAFPEQSASPAELAANRKAAHPAHVRAFEEAGFDIDTPIQRGRTLETIFQDDNANLEFFKSEVFQVFRITLNMYYSLLPTLAVSPVERFGMCHLVANAYVRNN